MKNLFTLVTLLACSVAIHAARSADGDIGYLTASYPRGTHQTSWLLQHYPDLRIGSKYELAACGTSTVKSPRDQWVRLCTVFDDGVSYLTLREGSLPVKIYYLEIVRTYGWINHKTQNEVLPLRRDGSIPWHQSIGNLVRYTKNYNSDHQRFIGNVGDLKIDALLKSNE